MHVYISCSSSSYWHSFIQRPTDCNTVISHGRRAQSLRLAQVRPWSIGIEARLPSPPTVHHVDGQTAACLVAVRLIAAAVGLDRVRQVHEVARHGELVGAGRNEPEAKEHESTYQ
jgi:hypothetical protein